MPPWDGSWRGDNSDESAFSTVASTPVCFIKTSLCCNTNQSYLDPRWIATFQRCGAVCHESLSFLSSSFPQSHDSNHSEPLLLAIICYQEISLFPSVPTHCQSVLHWCRQQRLPVLRSVLWTCAAIFHHLAHMRRETWPPYWLMGPNSALNHISANWHHCLAAHCEVPGEFLVSCSGESLSSNSPAKVRFSLSGQYGLSSRGSVCHSVLQSWWS